jgi:ATP-dependent DNA helicase RecG
MLTEAELRTLISDSESDRVERTMSLTNFDKFAEAVCAFANDLADHRKPGYLVLGVSDAGRVLGASVTDQLLQNLAALRSDGNIQPLPALTAQKISLTEGEIAVIEVQPSTLPPVRYKGRVYVRIGPRRGIANEQEERLLSERRTSFARTFDASPLREATLDDLSLSLFAAYREQVVAPEVIAANHRTMQEQLASLRFFDLKSFAPTAAGVLMFARHPRSFLPGAYVQFLRLAGNRLTDPVLDQAEIAGDLLSQLRELDVRLKTVITTTLEPVSSLRERSVSTYAEIALRELLLNAMMHRDYASNTPVRFYCFTDRIEIQNPGGLYGEVTMSTLTQRNSYRNPIIAEAMKNLGYVNRFGYGIQRAQRALQENQQPPPEFSADHAVFSVVVRARG